MSSNALATFTGISLVGAINSIGAALGSKYILMHSPVILGQGEATVVSPLSLVPLGVLTAGVVGTFFFAWRVATERASVKAQIASIDKSTRIIRKAMQRAREREKRRDERLDALTRQLIRLEAFIAPPSGRPGPMATHLHLESPGDFRRNEHKDLENSGESGGNI